MIAGTADTMYPHGFYRPGPADREYVPNGDRMPCGSLPRLVRMHPDHQPSTTVFYRRLPDGVWPLGGMRVRWERTARVECGCGWSHGRTTEAAPGRDLGTGWPVGARRGLDDVAVRGEHVDHTLRSRR